MPFSTPQAEKKPDLYSLGTLKSIDEPAFTEAGTYIKANVVIAGHGAGRDQRYLLLFRPEWFFSEFDAATFDSQEDGKSLRFIYRRNINASDQVSFLRAICGAGEEGKKLFDDVLAPAVFSIDRTALENPPDSEEEAERVYLEFARAVVDTIRTVVIEGAGSPVFGFQLRQKKTKTDIIGADGKPVYQLDNNYDLNEFFEADEKGLERISKRVEKANAKEEGSAKILFEI